MILTYSFNLIILGLSMEERSQVNFDHPDSLDTALLETHIRQLKQGFSVQVWLIRLAVLSYQ